MLSFDTSQQRVLGLDPARHARVLGAPGSGKSTVLVEAYARVLERIDRSELDRSELDRSEGEVLAIAPNRLAAAALRTAIETRVERPLGGSPARTLASLAFSVLAAAAAVAGRPEPRLLTGTVHDEVLAAVIESRIAAAEQPGPLVPEVLRSPVLRAELREFRRVLDDFDLDPAALRSRLLEIRGRAEAEARTDLPDEDRIARWLEALDILLEADARLARDRPNELSTSALLREACLALRAGAAAPPKLLLVDDAQELGEGQLALLAACAGAGSSVWVFGDPDIATETFRGERTRALAGLAEEFARTGLHVEREEVVTLETVHRHGGELRGLIHDLTARIGSVGSGAQRAAGAAVADEGETGHPIAFAEASTPSEQIGVIAYRLRQRHLGLGSGTPLAWQRMAVICRARGEAAWIARGLAAHQVPTGVAAGGIVLREYRIVQELVRLLQHVLGIERLDAQGVLHLLSGQIGGLDPVAIRRLRGAVMLRERREAREEGRPARETDELVLDAFAHPAGEPVIDSRAGRALRRLGRLAAAGTAAAEAGGTPREALWALWDGARLAEEWQREALRGRGHRADEASRALDAVMELFYALQRHEEQASEQPIGSLLSDLLESAVPEDSLARRAERDAVTVTTPQGAVGREFDLVVVIGVQDGAWPNTRSRGSLLGAVALERWLRGGGASDPSRRDTIHDELRLFAQACSRARRELLVVSIDDDEHDPGPFFGFGRAHAARDLPSARLTLRGATAEMRRRVVADPEDLEARRSLAELASAGVPGAHPDEWYGVLPPSTEGPFYPLDEPEVRVPVSPSQMKRAETCPLNWAVGALGGGAGSVEMSLGTLVHHAFETVPGHDVDALVASIMSEWRKLPFAAEWESERMRRTAGKMAIGLAEYLREFEASDRRLLGREESFSISLGRAELRGIADRLEGRSTDAGLEVSVVDLKTGTKPPTGPETSLHAQLQAYQLGIMMGAFDAAVEGSEHAGEAVRTGGARLLFVHPKAAGSRPFTERAQPPLDDEAREAFVERVVEIARVMAAGTFTARIDHHCADPFQRGDCRIHIVPAVSFA